MPGCVAVLLQPVPWPLPAAGQSHTCVFLFSISVRHRLPFLLPSVNSCGSLSPPPGPPSQRLPLPQSLPVTPPPTTCPKVAGQVRGGREGTLGERGQLRRRMESEY